MRRALAGVLISISLFACNEEKKPPPKVEPPKPKTTTTTTAHAATSTSADPNGVLKMVLFAIDSAGKERPLKNGKSVKQTEKVRFAYENPHTKKKTLALIGLEATAIHWYYPLSADQPPLALEEGEPNELHRVPGEIDMSKGRQLGLLVIAVGVDVPPAALEASLKQGTAKQDFGDNVSLLHLNVIPGP